MRAPAVGPEGTPLPPIPGPATNSLPLPGPTAVSRQGGPAKARPAKAARSGRERHHVITQDDALSRAIMRGRELSLLSREKLGTDNGIIDNAVLGAKDVLS